VLAYVRRGEVVAGIVYGTEARAAPDVVVLDTATGAWAPRPEVVAGVVAGAARATEARAFVTYLTGAEAQTFLRGYGFTAP
jgi:molybdate transport system substrate-binding protein